jgi:hypothetical protein
MSLKKWCQQVKSNAVCPDDSEAHGENKTPDIAPENSHISGGHSCASNAR